MQVGLVRAERTRNRHAVAPPNEYMKYLTLCAAEMSIPRQCAAVDLNALLCGSNHLLHGQARDDSAVVEGAEGSERVLHGVRVPCLRARATLAAGRLASQDSLAPARPARDSMTVSHSHVCPTMRRLSSTYKYWRTAVQL
jgi:hypothetical protein